MRPVTYGTCFRLICIRAHRTYSLWSQTKIVVIDEETAHSNVGSKEHQQHCASLGQARLKSCTKDGLGFLKGSKVLKNGALPESIIQNKLKNGVQEKEKTESSLEVVN